MPQEHFYPNWQDQVTYGEKSPQPKVLLEGESYKSVLAGMQAGARMPSHAEGPAVFHFLEGSGKMIVGDQQYAVSAGATVIVPDQASRGIEASTRLAFLAVRLG